MLDFGESSYYSKARTELENVLNRIRREARRALDAVALQAAADMETGARYIIQRAIVAAEGR
jgi:hypothetical protein